MFPGFKPSNHPHQVATRGVRDDVDDRETPPDVFDPLDAEFSFTLDGAASEHNAKCKAFCTLGGTFVPSEHNPDPGEGSCWDPEDGLAYPWGPEHRVYLNPPFSGLLAWVEKAWSSEATVVMLLPANRTEQPFWQDHIEPFRDRAGSILTTRFLRKRRCFLLKGEQIGNRTSVNPPFGIVIVIWDRRGVIRAPGRAQ